MVARKKAIKVAKRKELHGTFWHKGVQYDKKILKNRVTPTLFSARIDAGWDMDKAAITPKQYKKPLRFTDNEGRVVYKKFENLKLDPKVIRQRLYDGWTFEDAFSEPVHGKKSNRKRRLYKSTVRVRKEAGWNIKGQNVTRDQINIALKNGVTYNCMRYRLTCKNPMTIEEAINTPNMGGKGDRTRKPKEIAVSKEDIKQWKPIAMKKGIPLDMYLSRVYSGIHPKEAVEMGTTQ